jgi:hypothetical protein
LQKRRERDDDWGYLLVLPKCKLTKKLEYLPVKLIASTQYVAKLPIDLSGRQVRAALKQAGFVFRRQRGSHMISAATILMPGSSYPTTCYPSSGDIDALAGIPVGSTSA